MITRFAPSTTGNAHPGTLLSGLLCWLFAKTNEGQVFLRLEDLDPQRCNPKLTQNMIYQLEWFGLTWDHIDIQSAATMRHQNALADLCKKGLVYACDCSRKQIAERLANSASLSGYDNRCRPKIIDDPSKSISPLRIKLNASLGIGDTIVRRRDGAIAYQLATVVDDIESGVTHLIRGRDLLDSMPVQLQIYEYFGAALPKFRHHFLLLEPHSKKLAKFHGAVGVPELQKYYDAAQLCGILAFIAGLQKTNTPTTPNQLPKCLDWKNLPTQDVSIAWRDNKLVPTGI